MTFYTCARDEEKERFRKSGRLLSAVLINTLSAGLTALLTAMTWINSAFWNLIKMHSYSMYCLALCYFTAYVFEVFEIHSYYSVYQFFFFAISYYMVWVDRKIIALYFVLEAF